MGLLIFFATFNIFIIGAIISRVDCIIVNFSGKIADNRTISECVNGYKSPLKTRNSKMYMTTSQYALKEDYLAEDHVIKTEDGYILTLHRIFGRQGAAPVFLQHGLIGSSFDWLISGKRNALAFKLANAGYDVWLGNFRGNTYSRCHTKYGTSTSEFWNFSWHEMGIYDLPAMITYVKKRTGQKVIYIGHSMGTTAFFVMASERHDMASKVKVMFALSPIAYIDHSTSPLHLLAPYTQLMEVFAKADGTAEILSQTPTLKRALQFACNSSTSQKRDCSRILFSAFGFNPQQFKYSLLPDILYHVPAGTSLKVLIHYFQEYNSGKFVHYDYGAEKNLKLYNGTKPRSYRVSKITIPVGLIWSDSDLLANPIDIMRLFGQLPNTILYYRVNSTKFNHLDYLYAMDAPKLVYKKLLSAIKNYK